MHFNMYTCRPSRSFAHSVQQSNIKLIRHFTFSRVCPAGHRGDAKNIPDDLLEFTHGRGRKERIDSVNIEILEERKLHFSLMENTDITTAAQGLLHRLEGLGLGRKRRRNNVFSAITNSQRHKGHAINNAKASDQLTMTGAGGHGIHLSSSAATKAEDWPLFQHILPELAFAGHSNCGKSTLVNAMIGVFPRKGPASVSDRAGWTDQICFYQLGKRPPKLILSDLPGYGYAVAKTSDLKFWKQMTRSYLGDRLPLIRCCVLVDCTRGLCTADKQILRFLRDKNVPWHIVLTKADLLSEIQLAQSIHVVNAGVNKIFLKKETVFAAGTKSVSEILNETEAAATHVPPSDPLSTISPVSASTGAGITHFWKKVLDWVDTETMAGSSGETAVKEHKNAAAIRRAYAVRARVKSIPVRKR